MENPNWLVAELVAEVSIAVALFTISPYVLIAWGVFILVVSMTLDWKEAK